MAGSLVRQSDWVENLSNSFPVNTGATIAWMGASILSPFKCNRVAKRYPLIHRITNNLRRRRVRSHCFAHKSILSHLKIAPRLPTFIALFGMERLGKKAEGGSSREPWAAERERYRTRMRARARYRLAQAVVRRSICEAGSCSCLRVRASNAEGQGGAVRGEAKVPV